MNNTATMSVPFYTQQTPESFRSDVAPITKGVNERTLSRYLGEQLVSSQPNPLDRLNYNARNLPDMFRGRRLQLQDSIEGFILNGFEFYTYLIPWLVTNEKSVKMNVYRHNVRAATPTPNKGVSRMQTHQTSTKEATVERFGAAFMMEGDMMGTPEGDRQYIRNLMGMAQGCQLRVNEETMAALIDCKNYVQDYMEYRGRRSWIEDVMEMEINRFAGMAADPNFLDQVVAQSISVFKNRSLTPGAIIGWETLPFLDAMVATGSKTGFWQLGPDGRDVFVAGPDAVATIQKLPLFLARPFTVNEDDGPKQFLARDTTVGEYYPMSFTERRGELFGPGGSTYTSDQREIRIYDYATDSWKPITLKEALANCRIWYTNPGSYTQELRDAVREANLAVRKQNGFKEKAARYKDPQALDHQTKFTRTENMMFAHAPDARLMFLPLFIGQFDTDVIQTSDLLQMAQQFLQSAFGVGAAADKIRVDVENARNFVHRWETEAGDNDAFWDALGLTNAARSITTNGEWAGEQVAPGAPRDWKGNATASLDLPQNPGVLFPPGYANWFGFNTVIAQGVQKGYDGTVVNNARDVNDIVSRVTRQTTRVGGRSAIAQAAATPEWFHMKSPESTTWEILFGRRAPIFLAAPTGNVSGNVQNRDNVVKKPTQESDILYNSYPGQYNLYGTMPSGSLLAATLATYSAVPSLADFSTKNSEYTRVFTEVVKPLSSSPTADEIAENLRQEAGRKETLRVLNTRIARFTQEEDKAYRGYYATQEVFNALGLEPVPIVDDAYRAKFFDLATSPEMKLKPAAIDKKNKEYDDKYKTETNKASVDDRAATIFRIGYGDVEPSDITQANNIDFVNKKADLRKMLLPTKTKTQTPMTNLLAATENLEKLGRRYGNFSWDNLQQWATQVAGLLNDEASQELAEAVETYNSANSDMRKTWNSVFATGPKQTHEEEDDDDEPTTTKARKAGKQIASTRYFFRAPLSMTRQLLYTSSENSDPRIRAADPDTGFRTLFYPQHSPNTSYFEDEMLSMGKMPFMADIGDKALHDFQTASVVQGMLVLPTIKDDQHVGYVAPNHIIKAASKFGGSQKLFEATQKRKAMEQQAAASSYEAQAKRRAVAETASERPLLAAQSLELNAQRGLEKSVRLRQQDADDDVDDKLMHAGTQYMSTGPEMGDYDEEEREAVDQGTSTLQTRPQTTNDYNMLMASPTMAYRWSMANKQDELTRLAMLYIMMMRADDYMSQVALIDANVTLPYNFLIWRLHITISMYSLIVMVPGRETGVNIIGDRNFAMQEQVVDKIAVGHLTFYHKCIIWKPQNVDHLLDIYPQKVRCGWDMTWVEKAEDINSNPKKDRGSCISWIMPVAEPINKAAVSFIGGSVNRMQPLTTNLPDTSLASILTMAPFYADKVWKIDRSKTTYTGEFATFKKSRKVLNVVAYAGKYIAWDKSQKVWNLKTQGTGHLRGVKSGPLTKEIWGGQSTKLFPQAITTQSLN